MAFQSFSGIMIGSNVLMLWIKIRISIYCKKLNSILNMKLGNVGNQQVKKYLPPKRASKFVTAEFFKNIRGCSSTTMFKYAVQKYVQKNYFLNLKFHSSRNTASNL